MPNELVKWYRAQRPDDTRSDEEITLLYGDQFGLERLGAFPDAVDQYKELKARTAADESSIGNEFGKAVRRGVQGLQSTAAGAVALAADAAGAEGIRDKMLKVSNEYAKEAAKAAPAVPEASSVTSLKTGAQYAAGLLGEAAPSIAESVAVGVAGAAAGSAAAPGPGTAAGALAGFFSKQAAKSLIKKGIKELTEEALKKEMRLIAARSGATLANLANSYGLSSGEIYTSLANDPNVDPETAVNVALSGGAIAALPDTVLPSYIINKSGVLKRLSGAFEGASEETVKRGFYGYVSRFAKEAPITMGAEGSTEMFQEYINIAAEKYANPEKRGTPLTQDEKDRILKAGAAGMAGGFLAAPGAAMRFQGDQPPASQPNRTSSNAATSADSTSGSTPPPASAPTEGKSSAPDTETTSEGLSVTRQYVNPDELTAEEKQLADNVIQREAEGEMSPDLTVAKSAVLANPKTAGYYSLNRKPRPATTTAPPEALDDETQAELEAAIAQVADEIKARQEVDASAAPVVVSQPDAPQTQADGDAGTTALVPAVQAAPEVAPVVQEEVAAIPEQEVIQTPPAVETPALVPQVDPAILRAREIAAQSSPLNETEAPAAPLAQVIPPEQFLSLVGFDTAALRQGEQGAGKKGVTAFTQTSDRAEIYQDAIATSGDKNSSRKLAVFEAPDGNIIIGTAYRNGSGENQYRVSIEDSDGRVSGRRFKDLVAEGYKPIAALKTDQPSRGLAVTYSPTEWQGLTAEMRQMQGAAARTMEAVASSVDVERSGSGVREQALSDQIEEQRDRISEGFAAVDQEDQADAETAIVAFDSSPSVVTFDEAAASPVFTREEAVMIWDALERQDNTNIYRVLDELEPELSDAVRIQVAKLIKAGEVTSETDAEDAKAMAVDAIEQLIDAAYEGSKNKEEFIAGTGALPGEVSGKQEADGGDRAASEVRFRPEQAVRAEYLIPDTRLRSMFVAAMDGLRSRGVDVSAVQKIVDGVVKEVGVNYGRAIELSIADIQNPTADNMVLLFHEAAHEIFRGESPEFKARISRAIRAATNEQLNLPADVRFRIAEGLDTEAVTAEERLVESVARGLVQEGFNAEEAQGIIQQIWRLVTDIYFRLVMALQEAVYGVARPSTAQNYIANRLRSFLAGDRQMSFLDFMGGAPEYSGTDPERIRYRDLSRINSPFDPTPDLEMSPALGAIEVASANAVNDALFQAYTYWDDVNAMDGKVPFEAALESQQAFGLKSLPSQQIASVQAKLQQAGMSEVDTASKISGLNPESQKRAAYRAGSQLNRVITTMANRRIDAEQSLKDLAEEHDRNSIRIGRTEADGTPISGLLLDYTDADQAARLVREEFEISLQALKADIKSLGSDTRKQSRLAKTIGAIEGKINRPIMQQYETMLGRLYKKYSGQGAWELFDIIDAVADLNLEWQTTPRKDLIEQLKAAGNTSPLIDRLVKDRPLLAMVVDFSKRNDFMLAAMQLRRASEIDERKVVNEAIRVAMSEAKDSVEIARAKVARLPKLAIKAEKLLNKVEELKKRQRYLFDEQRRLQGFIEFDQDVRPLMKQELEKLEKIYGGLQEDWEPVQGAKYFVPPSANASVSAVKANAKELRLNAEGIAPKEIKRDAAMMRAWLANVPENERGGDWHTINRMAEKLEMVSVDTDLNAVRNSLFNRLMGSVTDKLDFVGSPLAKQIARMVRYYEAQVSSFSKVASEEGERWASMEADAMRAMGYRSDQLQFFRSRFYDKAMKYLESRPDILAAAANSTEALEIALPALRSYLEQDPDTGNKFDQDGRVWAALERYYRQTGATSDRMAKIFRDLGLKVQDEDGRGYRIFRDLIQNSPITLMRWVSDAGSYAYDITAKAFDATNTAGQIAKNVAKAYAEPDAEGSKAVLKPLTEIPAEVWSKFVRPIIYKTGASAFSGRETGDGEYNLALREQVIAAFERSTPGNLIQFAENLYAEAGNEGDMSAFVGDTIGTFQAYLHQMHEMRQATAHANTNKESVPPRMMMDARKAENFPAEWMEYKPLDHFNTRLMVKLMTFEAAFGRDMKAVSANFAAAIDEQRAYAREYAELELASQGMPRKEREAYIRREAEQRGKAKGIPEYLTILRAAEKNAITLRKTEEQLKAFMGANGGQNLELKGFLEVVRAIAALLVQSPGSALMDTISLTEMPLRRMGVSTAALRMAARSGKNLFVNALGSFMEAFGYTIKNNAANNIRRLELGYRDSDGMLKFRERYRAALEEPVETMTSIPVIEDLERKAVQATRLARLLVSAGVKFKDPEGPRLFPTWKPQAIFTWVSQMAHAASIDSFWQAYEDLTGRAVEYFEQHPEAVNDPDLKLDAKKLGYERRFFGALDDEKAFEFLRESAQRLGLNLEEMARDAFLARQKNPQAPLMSVEAYRRIASLSQNEITLESNITNRPAVMLSNPAFNAMLPLVGWSLSKTNSVLRDARRNVKGEVQFDAQSLMKLDRDARAAALSMIWLYASLLPLGLAYAAMRDEYDEEIVGRKQNVRSLDGGAGEFGALVEATGRVGLFGIGGDALNSIVNIQTARPFSVDDRILALSVLKNVGGALSTWVNQGSASYATVWRPMMSAIGGSGYLQYADILNNSMALDNMESRVQRRINVNNYLRAAAREADVDVASSRGNATPSAYRPFVTDMMMAALANDPVRFRESYNKAVQVAMKVNGINREEAMDRIRSSYQSSHPYRVVFRALPTESQLRQVFSNLEPDEQQMIRSAVRLVDSYGERIGANAPALKKKKEGVSMEAARRAASMSFF